MPVGAGQIEFRFTAIQFDRVARLSQLRERGGALRQAVGAFTTERPPIDRAVFAGVGGVVITRWLITQEDGDAFGLQGRLYLVGYGFQQVASVSRGAQRFSQFRQDVLRVVSLPEKLAVNHGREKTL